jgi:hypothetical protein
MPMGPPLPLPIEFGDAPLDCPGMNWEGPEKPPLDRFPKPLTDLGWDDMMVG